MKKQISYKIVSLVFSILVICFAIAFYTLADWQEPKESQPGGNVDPPINIGGDFQTKQGPLAVHGVFDAHSTVLLASQGGNVGIGTTEPSKKLEVVGGPIKATGGLIIETRTSDPASPETGRMWLRTDL